MSCASGASEATKWSLSDIEEKSAAGERHLAGYGGAVVEAIDDEVVALGLAADGLVDGRIDDGIIRRGAQRRTQIGGIVLAEAHIEHAGASQAHAVAAFAEIVAQRRDEAEPPPGLAHAHIPRRPAGAIV